MAGKLTDPRGEPTATSLQKGQYQIPFCLQLSDLNREVSLYKVTKWLYSAKPQMTSVYYSPSPRLTDYHGRGDRKFIRTRSWEGLNVPVSSECDRTSALGNSRQLWLPAQDQAGEHSGVRNPHLTVDSWWPRGGAGQGRAGGGGLCSLRYW